MLNTQFSSFDGVKEEIVEEQNRLEASLNLSDAYFEKIISLTGDVSAGFTEVSKGEIRYGGRITFNVVYIGDGMERIEAGAEFSFKKAGFFEGGTADVKYNLGEVTLKRNGGMLYAEAVIEAVITFDKMTNVTFLSDVDVLKKEEVIEVERTLRASQTFELDDEFECVKLKRILCSSATSAIIHAESVNGAVVCDGETVLSCVLLPFMQNNDILKEKRTIPFHLEIDVDGAEANAPCAVRAEVTRLNLKVYVDEESEKSTVTANIALKLYAFVQKSESLNSVCDVYSCKNEIAVKTENVECDCISGMLLKTEKINGVLTCDIPENSRFIAVIGEKLEIVSIVSEGDELKIDALLTGDAVFVDGDGFTVSRRAELPVSVVASKDFDGFSNPEFSIFNLTSKLRNGRIEIEATLRISLFKISKNRYKLVTEVEEGAEKCPNNAAISVYIAKKGDTEWDVMKQLGASIDTVYELNPTLEFPLSGNERVILYRQKT